MSVLNPDHLFEQADKLIAAPAAGPPRQVDLRRAASGAYYALFHFVAISLGDEFVGVTQRSTARYSVVYRSVDHRALRELCSSVTKVTPPQKLARYLPTGGFGRNIVVFANAVIDLQEQRHRADYDPSARYRTSEVATIIETGRSGTRRFQKSNEASRKIFPYSSPLSAAVTL